MRKFLAIVAGLGLLSGTLVFAQDAAKAEEAFKKVDKNSDGKVTLEEFKETAKDATKAEGRFKRIDKDGDGNITLEEFKASFGKKKDKKD